MLCFLAEDATELSCRYVDQLFEHGESWQNDCNRCTCHNGTTDCTKVVCGPLNCYKNHYLNCSCRQKHDTDCLTPPCRQWGECGSFKTASISRGGCVPSNTEVNLSENCALLNINFEKVKLPVVSISLWYWFFRCVSKYLWILKGEWYERSPFLFTDNLYSTLFVRLA